MLLVTPVQRSPNHAREDGFTTIELALVVAATLIVVALGVSMYRTYSARAQVATSIEESVPVQRLVVAAFKTHGTPPYDAAAAGIDGTAHLLLAGTYLESLEVVNGRIELRFGAHAYPALAGQTLSLTPFETATEDVVWVCGNQAPGVGLKPLGFAGGALQPVQVATPIEDRYLPRTCR